MQQNFCYRLGKQAILLNSWHALEKLTVGFPLAPQGPSLVLRSRVLMLTEKLHRKHRSRRATSMPLSGTSHSCSTSRFTVITQSAVFLFWLFVACASQDVHCAARVCCSGTSQFLVSKLNLASRLFIVVHKPHDVDKQLV